MKNYTVRLERIPVLEWLGATASLLTMIERSLELELAFCERPSVDAFARRCVSEEDLGKLLEVVETLRGGRAAVVKSGSLSLFEGGSAVGVIRVEVPEAPREAVLRIARIHGPCEIAVRTDERLLTVWDWVYDPGAKKYRYERVADYDYEGRLVSGQNILAYF